jgi:PAS domain S-box-containing protein
MLTRKALELLRLLADGEPGSCVLILDHQLRVLVGSEEGLRIGATADGGLRPPLQAALESALAGPRAASGVVRFACELAGPHGVEVRTTSADASSLGFGHVLRIRPLATEASTDAASRWPAACELLDGGVWDWDLARRQVWLSARWKHLIGHAEHEIGTDEREWSGRIHPDDVDGLQAALQRHFDGRDVEYEHVFRLRHREGHWIDYRGRGKVVERAADGTPLRMVGIGFDVSAERRQRAAADRQAWVLRQALRVARAGHWVWDAASDQHEISPQFAAMFGVQPHDLSGPLGKLGGLVTPRSFAAILAARQRALETGEPYDLEIEGWRADGTPIVLRSRAEPLREADGRVRALLGVAVDITAQRRAENDLQRRKDLLERMSELAGVGGWEYQPATGRLQWTRETWRIHGLEPGDAPPVAQAMAFYPGEAAEVIDELFSRAVARGEPYDVELPFRDAEGRVRWVRTSGKAELDAGRCVRVFGAIQDITGSKQQALRLAEAGARLAQQNADLDAFAGIAAHDLKEPARKVESFIDLAMAKASGGDPALAPLLARARDAAARLRTLVDDLLDLARAGSREVDLQPVDLDALLGEVLLLLDREIHAAGASIARGPVGTVEGDARLLRQMLQNLLSNALKFRQPGRPVEIAVRDAAGDSERLRLEVRDNGIGFDPAHAARILQPFRRLHGRSEYEGTGIGLALVQRIVQRHHGQIAIEAVPGEGACFAIDLPRVQPIESLPDTGAPATQGLA